MLTEMRLRGFKSWKDTGDIALRPITGFFGTNSSGKTSLLQALLLLKQTAESSDRGQIFHFGDGRSLVDLGDVTDVVHRRGSGAVSVSLDWIADAPAEVRDSENQKITESDARGFSVAVAHDGARTRPLAINEMSHRIGGASFGMRRNDRGYQLFAEAEDFRFLRSQGRPRLRLPPPVRCYGFPVEVRGSYRNAEFLSDLESHFERQMDRIHYLGPLRAYPERRYRWTGSRPSDMGRAGELAVAAILAARAREDKISMGRGRKRRTLEEHVAHWLRELGLIHAFRVEPLTEGLFKVLVRQTADSAEVPITDVGFGVSQILPVLVLCFYAPTGSTILLEQPEIHLHPLAQSGLADALLDARKRRNVQILIESHSEHLLRRLQLRVSEEKLSASDVALWFCGVEQGESRATKLRLDVLGSIGNWPRNFFGDQFGEVAAMAENRLQRSMAR